MLSAASVETPAIENMRTVVPSRTPNPPKEIGNSEIRMIKGMAKRKKIKGNETPIAKATCWYIIIVTSWIGKEIIKSFANLKTFQQLFFVAFDE